VQQVGSPDCVANTLDGDGYTYDNAGNRTSKANSLNGTTEQYTYDPLYQLTQVTQGATTTESYSFDAVGNRLSSLGVSSYTYNSSNQLTATPAVSFTYDNNGNTLTKTDSTGTRTYAWDFENRLTSVVLPGSGGTVTFRYDSFGRRIQKSSANGTTNYLYDGANAIEEVDQSGNPLARYAQAASVDEPLAELRSGTASFYQQDGLGSVTSLSTSTGTLANTYTYDAFGNLTVSTGTLTNPFQYTGRDYDPETGLRYYRARYYDPAIGRFISEDPLQFGGGDVNFYAYVGNSPTNEIDPLGLCPPNKGCRLTVSCGPKPATHGYSHCTVTVQNGDTYTAYDGEPADSHVFWGTLIVVANKVKGAGGYNFIDQPVPCDCAQKEADAINAAHLTYSAFFQNSNTAAAMITQACGIFTPFRSTDTWGWGPADPITGPWGTSNSRPLTGKEWRGFPPWTK
jgi:RHS repeat-associated protein